LPEIETLPLITAELHCHTYRSKDSLMLPDRLLKTCRRRGIDRIAITDHNTIEGALEAQQLDAERVIVGEEIMTDRGELLGYYVSEMIPAGLSPKETIERLRDQGAVISVSHPFDSVRKGSWAEDDLRQILPSVDAIETFNARSWTRGANDRAQALADEVGITGTAGSDAHAYLEIGRALMRMPEFEGPAEMKAALLSAEIAARRSSPLVHFLSRYASLQKRLGKRRA
jgi:predicted metal-dependent phosphoesterase TrpH